MRRFRLLPLLTGASYASLGALLLRAYALAPEAAVLRFAVAGHTVEISALAAGTALLGVGCAIIAVALLARAPLDLSAAAGRPRQRYVDAATRLPVHYFAQGPREWLWNRFVARLWLQFALLVSALGLLAEYLDR